MSAIEMLLEHALQSRIDVLLFGPAASGKSALAREIVPKAPLLHGEELCEANRVLLRSLGQSEAVIVVENITASQYRFLQPILTSRSILGAKLKCTFLLTTREPFSFEEGIALGLNVPPIEAWISHSGAHPALTALIETYPALYEKLGLRRLDTLSRMLNSRPSEQILKEAIAAIIGEENEAVEALSNAILQKPAPLEPAPSAPDSSVFHTTKEQADRHAEALIEKLQAGGGNTNALLAHLRALRPEAAVGLLAQILHASRAQEALEGILKDPAIRSQIDTLLENG
jgi:hypothetical protein